ncbi:MAG: HAD family hydrolase [Thermoproteota archaeon]
MVKVVSLDVTGTLVDGRSVKYFWDSLIPSTYASRNNISFEEAFSYVKQRYSMVSDEDLRWYLPEYWIEKLNIEKSCEELLEELKSKVTVFPDVEPAIIRLSSDYSLIVSSNLPRVFLKIVLGDLEKYFSRIFSSVSTYSLPHKTAEFYSRVCRDMGVSPGEVLHVGDNMMYDYVVPRVMGMRSLLIRRYTSPRQSYEVGSLEDVLDRLTLKQ